MFTLLALLLIPSLDAAHLPLQFAWSHYLFVYYVVLFAQSVLVASLLFALGYPSEFWRALSGKSGKSINPLNTILSFSLPGTYLFFVLVLTFAYNDVIATFRFDGTADAILNRMDSILMGGLTVGALSHGGPADWFKWLEIIYFGMYLQVGACLLLLALREGRRRAFEFAGMIATAYFIALACFYFLPATGPFYLSLVNHDGGYVGLGGMAAHTLNAIQNHQRLTVIGTDYFIGFPCMHITQPLIVLWFLRKVKRIVTILALYDIGLIAAILLLQEHYVIDVIGGGCVAVLAIAITDELPTTR